MRLSVQRAEKQFAIICAASLLTLVVPKMFRKLKAARIWAVVTGILGFLLLLAVLLRGRLTYGANLTLEFKGIAVQPSEFVKISFVLLTASLFRERVNIGRIIISGLITLGHVGVLVLSTDLGAALIFAMSYLVMLYAATKRPIILAGGFATGIGAAIAAYRLFGHVKTRVEVWVDPWQDYQGKGYQIANSLFGIATGGWFGQGLYRGNPTRIPKCHSDFIFASICEEMGGITGICIILICLACILFILRIASDLILPFYRITGTGLAVVYGTQVLLNIGGVIRFIPSTGVTLPFISYGVNSCISTLILFGIVQELYIKQQNEVERVQYIRQRSGILS